MNTMTLTPHWFPGFPMIVLCSYERIKTISKTKWVYHLEDLGMRLDSHFLWQSTVLQQPSFPRLSREMGRVASTVS